MWSEEKTNVILNLEELKSFAYFLREKYWHISHCVFFLYGSLGVGKTQLIKYILDLDILSPLSITSPTFNLLNIYKGKNGEEYLHFDLYRKEKESMDMDHLKSLGFTTLYETEDNKCFVEWPEKIRKTVLNHISGIHIKIRHAIEETLEDEFVFKENKRYIDMEVR